MTILFRQNRRGSIVVGGICLSASIRAQRGTKLKELGLQPKQHKAQRAKLWISPLSVFDTIINYMLLLLNFVLGTNMLSSKIWIKLKKKSFSKKN